MLANYLDCLLYLWLVKQRDKKLSAQPPEGAAAGHVYGVYAHAQEGLFHEKSTTYRVRKND